ncbi:MAG: SDR family oxidoreductase [Candidatus Stahlbacteria bacterium]|nr:MAG: SDR family oxidoreductase [Candidatus Stahlbacteria bacterium]
MNEMKGKVCLVTGANSGIGKETALGLAKMGATVVMACRSKERGEAARLEIKRESGNTSVDLMLADLSSQSQIYRLAKEFKERYKRLDVLINNAGIGLAERAKSSDGIEMFFAVNHIAPFLLTHLLLERLKASAPSRIVNVSSFMHAWVNGLNLNELPGREKFFGIPAYTHSKLALLMFSYELARRLAGTGVTVNALNPGFVKTNVGHQVRGALRIVRWVIFNVFRAITPQEGAQTSIYLASSPEVEGVTGKYFSKQKLKASYDREAWQRLWKVSEELTGLAS